MSMRAECTARERADHEGFPAWFIEATRAWRCDVAVRRPQHRIPVDEAERVRCVIEGTVGDVFGIPRAHLGMASRGRAPVARARQVAMYLAHVSCRLCLTDVGVIFARDRTTVAHACAVIEDRRDDPVFDRTLELMEWIVPTLVGRDTIHDKPGI